MLLSRQWLEQHSETKPVEQYPERILQIGEGNFMRGFVDWLIHRLIVGGKYQGRVVVATPLAIGAEKIRQWNEQDGLYSVWQRGMENGQLKDDVEIVQSVSRCLNPYEEWEEFLACARNPQIDIVLSNTTEAGLTYKEEPYNPTQCPESFPAKLTCYLYERYQAFHGEAAAGLDIVPCELVENNGDVLRSLVFRHIEAWGLGSEFTQWVKDHNHFYNTLVDSIITGFQTADPKLVGEKIPYDDPLGVIREPFYLWVIQGDESLARKWDFPSLNLNVRYVPDVAPFRLIKVRILNGAHTSLAGLSYLAGLEIVKEVIADEVMGPFVRELMYEEIIPALAQQGVDSGEAQDFAAAVLERFSNPLLRHEIASLQLNGLSKIAVRLLPTFNDYLTVRGELPHRLVLAIAGQLLYYKNADNPADAWKINDNPEHVSLVQKAWTLEESAGTRSAVEEILKLSEVWGQDLSQVSGLLDELVADIDQIRKSGVKESVVHSISAGGKVVQ